MEYTAKYGFKKPEPTDPHRIADFNDNAEAMEAALEGLPDEIYRVGDIKSTVRTDLGEKWVLCNGTPVPEEFEQLQVLIGGNSKKLTGQWYTNFTFATNMVNCDKYFADPAGNLCTIYADETTKTLQLWRKKYGAEVEKISIGGPSFFSNAGDCSWCYARGTIYFTEVTSSSNTTGLNFSIKKKALSNTGAPSPTWQYISATVDNYYFKDKAGYNTVRLFSNGDNVFFAAEKHGGGNVGTAIYKLEDDNTITFLAGPRISATPSSASFSVRHVPVGLTAVVFIYSGYYNIDCCVFLNGDFAGNINGYRGLYKISAFGKYIYSTCGTYNASVTYDKDIWSFENGTLSGVSSKGTDSLDDATCDGPGSTFEYNGTIYCKMGDTLQKVVAKTGSPYYSKTNVGDASGLDISSPIVEKPNYFAIGASVKVPILPSISLADGVYTYIKGEE